MKKRIVAFLACLLAAAAVTPALASFETDATIPAFGKFKLSNVQTYDTALPKRGAKTTKKQILNLLNQIPLAIPGSGNTLYTYSLYFIRAVKGDYYEAGVTRKWIGKKPTYMEERNLKNPAGTNCSIDTENKSSWIYYSWKKGASQGLKFTYQKTGVGTPQAPKASDFKLYKDAKVLGQKCMVYSYFVKAENSTYYKYVSRKTGWNLKTVIFDGTGLIRCRLDFSVKNVTKPSSFFKPPARVTFIKGI